MKLYIKQKAFSWKDRFNISDMNGTPVYSVEGEVFTVGKKLHLLDANGNEVAFVHQKVFSFFPRYFVSINGEDVAEVVKEFSFLKPKYRVEGPGWRITGDYLSHNYEITAGDTVVAAITKKWMTWSDTFEIDVHDDRNDVLALSIVLIIDAVMDAEAASAAGSAH